MRAKPLLLGILLLLIGLGIGLYYFAYILPLNRAAFGPEGQETRGTILEMREIKSVYYADIAFEDANGQHHTVHNTYDFQKWYTLKESGSATIRYLQKDPQVAFEIHSLQAEKPNIGWYLFLCAGFSVSGLILMFAGLAHPGQADETDYPVFP